MLPSTGMSLYFSLWASCQGFFRIDLSLREVAGNTVATAEDAVALVLETEGTGWEFESALHVVFKASNSAWFLFYSEANTDIIVLSPLGVLATFLSFFLQAPAFPLSEVSLSPPCLRFFATAICFDFSNAFLPSWECYHSLNSSFWSFGSKWNSLGGCHLRSTSVLPLPAEKSMAETLADLLL